MVRFTLIHNGEDVELFAQHQLQMAMQERCILTSTALATLLEEISKALLLRFGDVSAPSLTYAKAQLAD
jgi:hypothetical protein